MKNLEKYLCMWFQVGFCLVHTISGSRSYMLYVLSLKQGNHRPLSEMGVKKTLCPPCCPDPTLESSALATHTGNGPPPLRSTLAPAICPWLLELYKWSERTLLPGHILAYCTRDSRRHPMSLYIWNHVALRENAAHPGVWGCRIQNRWCWTEIWLNEKVRASWVKDICVVCVILNWVTETVFFKAG